MVIHMRNNNLLVIYKKVGKFPELKKVENKIEVLEELVGGEIEFIPYEDVTIIARKNRNELRANIYISGEFMKIGKSVKGDIVVTCLEEGKFKSINKEQAMKYREFLTRESFKYEHFNKEGKYSPTKLKNNKYNYTNEFKKKEIIREDTITDENNSNEEVMQMILRIQTAILQYIKNNN